MGLASEVTSQFLFSLLPPANEFCEGYVFTPVCQSFCSQGGALQAPRPTPRGEVEGSGLGGLQAHTQGISRPTPKGGLQAHTQGGLVAHTQAVSRPTPGGLQAHTWGGGLQAHTQGGLQAHTWRDPSMH